MYPNAISTPREADTQSPLIARLRACLRGTAPGRLRRDPRYGVLSPEDTARVEALFLPNPTAAAVLLPIIDHPGGPTLLFTERASMLKHHAGQIAFPGGRVEPEDGSALAGALRETAEEIGLLPSAVEVLGYLPEHLVISGYCVTPVVGLVTPGFRLAPDPREVASVFEVPLDYLLDPVNLVPQRRKIGGVVEVLLQEFQWEERRIWGATASMVLLLAEALRQGHVAHA